MKFSTSFSVLALVLPTIVSAVPAAGKAGSVLARQNNNQGGNQRGGGRFGQGQGGGRNGQGQGQGQNNNQGGNANAGGAAAGGAAAGGAAAGGAAAGGAAAGGAAAGGAAAGGAAAGGAAAGGAQNNAGNNNNGGGAAAGGGDPATSTTLDASVIAAGFADDGQNPPVDGQSASLTSTNNFINFCVGKTITNGQQLKGGSCNPCPIGDIPSFDNMPSAKFVFPANGDTSIAPNTAFTIKMQIQKMQTGVFVNAQKNYFAAPQQLNGGGQIIGHTHFTVEALGDGVGQTTPTDPGTFVFFKGINDPAANGIASTSVDDGLPAGAYRVCSINSSSNHQPVIVPVAQHGSLDDCAYFQVGAAAGGAAAGGAAAGGNANAGGAAAGGNANAGGAAAGGNANAGGAAAGGNANAGGAAAGGNANAGGAAAGGNANAGGAAAGGNANAGGAAAGGNANAGGNGGNKGQGQGGNKGGQGGNKNNRRWARFAREN